MTYIGTDERNRIVRYYNCNVSDDTGLILIDDDIITEFPFNEHGIPTWKVVGDTPVHRTESEIAADEQEYVPTPSQMDRIEAQTLYTALMTDTLIEE